MSSPVKLLAEQEISSVMLFNRFLKQSTAVCCLQSCQTAKLPEQVITLLDSESESHCKTSVQLSNIRPGDVIGTIITIARNDSGVHGTNADIQVGFQSVPEEDAVTIVLKLLCVIDVGVHTIFP